MNAPASPLAAVTVQLGDRHYDILIGPGLLGSAAAFDGLPTSSRAVIVSNPTVAGLYGAALASALRQRHAHVQTIELPDGEAHKDWTSLDAIFDALLSAGADRKTVLYALVAA